MQRTLVASALLFLTLAAPLARANEPSTKERAAALLQEGVQRRAEGKDDLAMQLFRRADELDSTPKSRAQLALAEQSLGLWLLAERHLQDALGHKDDPWIEKNRALLESSLTRIAGQLGWIDLMGAPAGAQLSIDGVIVGPTPLDAPARAAAGDHIVEVRAPGYEPYRRTVVVQSGQVSRERVALVVESPVEAKRGPTAAAPRYVDVPSPSPWRDVGWVTFGVGAAVAAFGGVSLIVRQSHVDSFNSDARCGTLAADQPDSCTSQQRNATRWGTMGMASLVAGGVVAAGGLVLVLVSPPQHTKVQVAHTFGCGVAGLGLSCAGRF